MSRKLLPAQKRLIDSFIKENTNTPTQRMLEDSVFSQNRDYLDIDDLPSAIYHRIEEINNSEILYQEVERYMSDKCSDIINK